MSRTERRDITKRDFFDYIHHMSEFYKVEISDEIFGEGIVEYLNPKDEPETEYDDDYEASNLLIEVTDLKKARSVKLYNIVASINVRKAIDVALKLIALRKIGGDTLETTKTILSLALAFVDLSSTDIGSVDAAIVLWLHNNKYYTASCDEQTVINGAKQLYTEKTGKPVEDKELASAVDRLDKLKAIELFEGKIRLIETVIVKEDR